VSTPGDESERLTATDRLQRRLEADILTRVLAPGVRIKPATLAPAYGVSVTPFREALARLQSRGLIEIDPFIGARVATMSSAEARDLFAVRLRLETDALLRTMRAGDATWEAHVRDVVQRLDEASETVGGASTATLIQRWLPGCGSPWTLRLLRDLYDHLDRYQALAWTDGGLRSPSLGEHHAMAEAALGRRECEAVEALAAHIESAVSWTATAVDVAIGLEAMDA
jgi:GntR family transcriptional regulator, carbon starvation induced regulator